MGVRNYSQQGILRTDFIPFFKKVTCINDPLSFDFFDSKKVGYAESALAGGAGVYCTPEF